MELIWFVLIIAALVVVFYIWDYLDFERWKRKRLRGSKLEQFLKD